MYFPDGDFLHQVWHSELSASPVSPELGCAVHLYDVRQPVAEEAHQLEVFAGQRALGHRLTFGHRFTFGLKGLEAALRWLEAGVAELHRGELLDLVAVV